MGIAERKTREKEERRSLILARAKELILERGVPALAMQDIADAAELSKATLYLYFESKEAILAEILAEAGDAFVAYVEARIAAEDSGLEALRKLWGSYLSMFGESQEIFVLIGIMSAIDPDVLFDGDREDTPARRPKQKLRRFIADVLARGVGDGTLEPQVDPDRIARTVLVIATAIMDSIARLPREQRDARLIREEMRSVFELLLRGLAAAGTDRALLRLEPQ